MDSKLLYATIDSPVVTIEWSSQSEPERIGRLTNLLSKSHSHFFEKLEVVGAKKDGQVIVRMLKAFGAAERGALFLDLEEFLKKSVDQGLTFWGQPLGDKNSLRNLRGIEVKKI